MLIAEALPRHPPPNEGIPGPCVLCAVTLFVTGHASVRDPQLQRGRNLALLASFRNYDNSQSIRPLSIQAAR
jgi:hypothetical protein